MHRLVRQRGRSQRPRRRRLGASTGTSSRSAAATRWPSGSAGATATIVWQHHLLSVYHVTVDGDRASALSYLTSYQVFENDTNVAKTLVARYHDELRRTPAGWKISRRVAEFLWGESRSVDNEWLSLLGGRGPEVWRG